MRAKKTDFGEGMKNAWHPSRVSAAAWRQVVAEGPPERIVRALVSLNRQRNKAWRENLRLTRLRSIR